MLVDGDPLIWQALGGVGYELSDGYAIVPGLGGHATEDPPVDALSLVFAAGVLGTLRVPASTSTDVAIRRALAGGHITALVVAPGGRDSAKVASILTSALGPADPALRRRRRLDDGGQRGVTGTACTGPVLS